jgi:hypothetical protein
MKRYIDNIYIIIYIICIIPLFIDNDTTIKNIIINYDTYI